MFTRIWPATYLLLALLTALTGTGAPAAAAQEPALPEEIVIERPGLLPEGVEYDALRGRFLVGSLSEGTIFEVSDDGTIEPFIEDPDLKSTVGIHIDASTDRLLVANTDRESGEIALGIYQLEDGERLHMVDLNAVAPEGNHFANDVTADTEGNAYVTDSFAPVIYRVSPDGKADVFARDTRWAVQGFGLNGIEFHPNGYLIAAVSGAGKLYKVPLGFPENVTQVETERSISADGLVLHAAGYLFAVVGGQGQVLALNSQDDWASAEIVATAATTGRARPTTAAIRQGEVYVVDAHLGADPPARTYEIFRVHFPDLPLTPAALLPERIVVTAAGIRPEGIEYDTLRERFLLSSLAEGTIYEVRDDGVAQPFIEDEGLQATIGIQIDTRSNRLLAANSDPAVFFDPDAPGRAGLGIFDLATGERLHLVELSPAATAPGERHFANDVAVDGDGNAYVTDSFSPLIYRVVPDGTVSTFVQDDLLWAEPFGANGIDYHPNGYLLVGITGNGALLKIPLDDPENVTQVETPPVHADGMVLLSDGKLVVVDGFQSKIVVLHSDDNWETAQVLGEVQTEEAVTTVAIRSGAIYALFARLSADPPADSYPIVRIDLPDTASD